MNESVISVGDSVNAVDDSVLPMDECPSNG